MPPGELGAPMAGQEYALLDAVGDTYWRYVARHELFLNLWTRHRAPRPQYRVLDVGCGAGAFLAFLRARAWVRPVGVDLFPAALAGCHRRGLRAVAAAEGTTLPFRSGAFDLVVAQDVLEHVEDDGRFLAEVFRVSAPGGLALVLVPAFQSLWSMRDVRLGHRRRYTLPQLVERTEAAGFTVLHRTYTDVLLFVALRAAVAVVPRTADGTPDLGLGAPGGNGWVKRGLLALARLEARLARRAHLPFGVSALVLAAHPDDPAAQAGDGDAVKALAGRRPPPDTP